MVNLGWGRPSAASDTSTAYSQAPSRPSSPAAPANLDPILLDKALSANDQRPGIFMNLEGFLKHGTTHEPDRRCWEQLRMKPGDIIHINDSDINSVASRLHQRVMLVGPVNQADADLVCFPLCKHEPVERGIDHWQVRSATGFQGSHRNIQRTLVVNFNGVEVAEGLTVNLGEAWHVEFRRPVFDRVGRVEGDANWNAAVRMMKALFCDKLDMAMRPPMCDVPSTLPAQQPRLERSPQDAAAREQQQHPDRTTSRRTCRESRAASTAPKRRSNERYRKADRKSSSHDRTCVIL